MEIGAVCVLIVRALFGCFSHGVGETFEVWTIGGIGCEHVVAPQFPNKSVFTCWVQWLLVEKNLRNEGLQRFEALYFSNIKVTC